MRAGIPARTIASMLLPRPEMRTTMFFTPNTDGKTPRESYQ
jgi:hypothetical protein